MDVYLPIANLSVNGLFIVALGALTGVLSGLFGVGGGFLTTPLLIFYGIPPTVAAASASTQVTGASVSGVLAHNRRGGVDYRMGMVTVVGGGIGSAIGALLFRFFQSLGQIDTVISILYVVMLGTIGILMAPYGLDTISGWLRQAQQEGSWTVSVVDQNGRLLGHPAINVFRPPVNVNDFEPVRLVREGKEGSGTFWRGEEEWFAAYAPTRTWLTETFTTTSIRSKTFCSRSTGSATNG